MTTTSHDTDKLSVTKDRAAWQAKQVDESAAPDAFTEFELVPKLPFPLLRRRSGVYARTRLLPSWPVLPTPFPIGRFSDSTGVDGDDVTYATDAPAYANELTPNPDGPLPPLPPGPHGGPFPNPSPIPLPNLPIPLPRPSPFPLPPKFRLATEELRVDVDGRAPTMTVSGVVPGSLFSRPLTWIARVRRTPAGTYAGDIFYRDGASSLLPQTHVEVALHPALPIGALSATATFSGGTAQPVTHDYRFARSWFREVNVEFDKVKDAPAAVMDYDTAAHPNRPASLPLEKLSVESTYGHMGIKVTRSAGDSVFDLTDAGANKLWSDVEMHDAMIHNWSRWVDIPQWAMWVLFARQHEMGSSLGGLMFDDIGTAQRQGCAIFSDSFVAHAPAGDPAPTAWVNRMLFWTAIHEMGHAFNLAHAWQKSLGTGWVPLTDEPEARSYMNYPYRVAAAPGSTPERTFFANFEFRFSDSELLFLRHAPARFVQMGNAAWFDQHAVEDQRAGTPAPVALDVRIHRSSPVYEFLEPIAVEIKLKNVSASPIVVDEHILAGRKLGIAVTREEAEAHLVRPYANRCFLPSDIVLQPGDSLYASVPISYDAYGFPVAEPGRYTVHAVLDLDEAPVLAAPIQIRVARPYDPQAEHLADEIFTDDVRGVLAVGGTRQSSNTNDVLTEVTDRLPDSRIAVHANAMLGTVGSVAGMTFETARNKSTIKAKLSKTDAKASAAQIGAAFQNLTVAADTFGHIGVTEFAKAAADALQSEGKAKDAGALVTSVADELESRQVKKEVIAALRKDAKSYQA